MLSEMAFPSYTSLLVEPVDTQGTAISTATGFLVGCNRSVFLITNRHVVLGRDSMDNPVSKSAVMPSGLRVWYETGDLQWTPHLEPLYASPGEPLWYEHPKYRSSVDVIALKVAPVGPRLRWHDPTEIDRSGVSIPIASDVSVVGFPFGLTAGGKLAIWSRGAIASEPAADFDNLPLLLIDSRTRQGQSGSPVIYWTDGRPLRGKDGSVSLVGGPPQAILVGVYSGRTHRESDLGRVWKARVIPEILLGEIRPEGYDLMGN